MTGVLLHATAVTRGEGGGTDTEYESTQKVNSGKKKILLPLPPGLELATFRSLTSPALYQQAIPAPPEPFDVMKLPANCSLA